MQILWIKTVLFGLCLLVPQSFAVHAFAQDDAIEAIERVAEDCLEASAEMACIAGGYFIRGSNEDNHNTCKQPSYNKKKQNNTKNEAKIWLDTFYMDKTEVTVKDFKACVAAKKCEKAGPKYYDFSRDKQPITGISWYDASNYCKVQGKHLPTEAEWEKAARGSDGDLYPWGSQPADCENSVIMDKQGRSCGMKKRGNSPEKGRVLEVCSRPASRYGLCDMIGNAEEWVADWYSDSYESCGEDCMGDNPKGPCKAAEKCEGHRYKLVRGGSWYWPAEHATSVHRRSHVPSNNPYHHFGFRCAASQAEMKKIRENEVK
ncbi:MAG: SUMF1/EgtB/PvdO family nonheme iron enzyme [Bradymonadales bacterium]|jgi:sulfatase modifying factor 1